MGRNLNSDHCRASGRTAETHRGRVSEAEARSGEPARATTDCRQSPDRGSERPENQTAIRVEDRKTDRSLSFDPAQLRAGNRRRARPRGAPAATPGDEHPPSRSSSRSRGPGQACTSPQNHRQPEGFPIGLSTMARVPSCFRNYFGKNVSVRKLSGTPCRVDMYLLWRHPAISRVKEFIELGRDLRWSSGSRVGGGTAQMGCRPAP